MIPDQLRRSKRYEVLRRVGAGGMGVVYEARARTTGERVAIKTLRDADGQGLYRLKREFRVLQGLVHENLIQLRELVEEDGAWFVVMDFVDGMDVASFARGAPATDPFAPTRDGSRAEITAEHPINDQVDPEHDRIRSVVFQIAAALDHLHAAGRVHRDLKTSNVMVEASGRVRVLDFGLTLDDAVADSTEGAMIGTVPYMAPEQACGDPVGSPSDCYALGVMLFEMLTGRWPFTGRTIDIINAKLTAHAPSAGAACPSVPADLDDLCTELLLRDPAARPTASDVIRRLGPTTRDPHSSRSIKSIGAMDIIGREEELTSLRDALGRARSKGAQLAWVRGASGIGKSSLLARFLVDVRERYPEAVVLAARCYENEFVPFKALDGIVDALSSFLRTLPAADAETLLPLNTWALAAAFPVLCRVGAVMRAPPRRNQYDDAAGQRLRAFAAMREILARIAERFPLVIVIDDIQWGDVDSIRLLQDVLRGDAPAGLFVLAGRSDARADSQIRELEGGGRSAQRIQLGPLSDEAARCLTVALAQQAGIIDQKRVADIPGAADRHPLHIQELVWHAARSDPGKTAPCLGDAIAARVAELEPAQRSILSIVSLAGGPISADTIRRALPEEESQVSRAVFTLVASRLIRSATTDVGIVEPYHDRIREAVDIGLDASQKRALHERLARSMDVTGLDSRTRDLVIAHYVACGAHQEAARHAQIAARDAEQRFAFRRAVDMYQLALHGTDLPPAERADLAARRANMLAATGQLVEAADGFRFAATLATGSDRLALEARAVAQLLRVGETARGMEVASDLLARVGVRVPRTRRVTLFRLLAERLRVRLRGLGFRERPLATVEQAVIDRLAVLWSLSSGFAFIDPTFGYLLQARYLREALDVGEVHGVVKAYSLELGYRSLPGPSQRAATESLYDNASALAKTLGVAAAEGFVEGSGGLAAYLTGGDLTTALDRMKRGASLLREDLREDPVDRGWQLDLCTIFSAYIMWLLGRFRELVEFQASHLHEAEERGNVFLDLGLRGGRCNSVWLIRDQPSVARLHANAVAASRAPDDHLRFHDLNDEYAVALIDLYEGLTEPAFERIDALWRRARKSHLLRISSIAVEAHWYRGAVAVAAGSAKARRKIAETSIRELEGVGSTYSRILAGHLRAAIRVEDGNLVDACEALRGTTALANSGAFGSHAAAADMYRGLLLGGREGRELTEAAVKWMTQEAVADPWRLASVLSPGLGVALRAGRVSVLASTT